MNIDRQAVQRQRHAGFMYLLDVLVVVVHISHSNCWSTYYCTRIEVSVLRAGRGRRDGGYGGGGGGVEVFSDCIFIRKNIFLGS